MNLKGILPSRISELLKEANDIVPHLFEDEADEYEYFMIQLALKHNDRLEVKDDA